MPTPIKEFVGTWEDLMAHADEFKEHRVRVEILENQNKNDEARLLAPQDNQKAIETFRRWRNVPLTAEEEDIMEEMEHFTRENRFSLRIPQDV